MGMDQAEALEAALSAALPGQGGNNQALGVPHQDVAHHALAIQEHPYLPVQGTGDFCQLPGQLRGEEQGQRHLAAVEPLQLAILVGF